MHIKSVRWPRDYWFVLMCMSINKFGNTLQEMYDQLLSHAVVNSQMASETQ